MYAFFKKFGVRVTAAIVCSVLLVAVLSGAMIYSITFRSQFEDLRAYLKSIAQTAAVNIDAAQLAQIPLTKEGVNTRPYAIIGQYLKKIRAANPRIKFIYVLGKTEDIKIWKFIIDDDNPKGRGGVSFPGDTYSTGRFREILRGFDEPSADHQMETDEWGTTLSGYAPVRDEMGRPMAVLGVDMDAQYIYGIQRQVILRTALVLAAGILVALLLGFLVSGRVVGPVEQLIAGARYIGEGNLHYQVRVPGNDEIARLADAFNEMAHNLLVSRQKLVSYFLDTVKAMVTVLEFRDHYTMGHSESVAYYAGRIAERMGVDLKTREFFHNVCLLHDIGKVGVRDSVLLKPDRLTDEEWRIIQLHPVWGEQILKPILQDRLMLSVIRNHHERYDGKGYPDGWKEEQIPLLVAIATVADSYDAMTSTRAYRKAMSREQAVEQIVNNKGTQFHPAVVDAFLLVLADEEKNPRPKSA